MIKKLFFLFVVVLSFSVFVNIAHCQTVSTPLIIKTEGNFPNISGTSSLGTEVLVYLDGKFAGFADLKNTGGQTVGFNFSGPGNLNEGQHQAILVARDKTSLVMSAPSQEIKFIVSRQVTEPVIFSPSDKEVFGIAKPEIIGAARPGSLVKIYIDDIYNGKTEKLANPGEETADFTYKPFLNLNLGQHQVYALAEDEQGNNSKKSKVVIFNIEKPMPAPTLKAVVAINANDNYAAVLTGLAKNNSLVRIYIDDKFIAQTQVKNHPSGTANFYYQISQPLTKGQHLVYTTAIDMKGKQSIKSNGLQFSLKQPNIAQAASTEKKEAVAKIGDNKVSSQKDLTVSPDGGIISGKTDFNSPETKLTEDNNNNLTAVDNEIKKIMESPINKATSQSGSINEGKQNQSKLRWSIIIFIIFLIGMVAWLIWVNRELIKEKNKSNLLK